MSLKTFNVFKNITFLASLILAFNTKIGRFGVDMVRWGFSRCDRCECGALQTRDHFRVCRHNPVQCSQKDLVNATENALAMAQYWFGRI